MPAGEAPRGRRESGTRVDPRRRRVDFTPAWAKVMNPQEGRRYALANLADPEAMHAHAAAGYEPETRREGGPSLGGGFAGNPNDTHIEVMGLVLMSCSEEQARKNFEEGPGGMGGQIAADELEEQIVDRNAPVEGGRDSLRGVHGGHYGRGLSVEFEESPQARVEEGLL